VTRATVHPSPCGPSARQHGRLHVPLLLSPHIPRFLALYPELSLELIARDQLGDLVGEGFDIAVRFGEPPSSSLVARKLIDTASSPWRLLAT